MFGLGLAEILMILIVAMLLFGPEELPRIARSIAKAFKKFSDELKPFSSYSDKELDEMKDEDQSKRSCNDGS